MNISVHLSNDYWLSVRGIKQKLDLSDTEIRRLLKDSVRGGVVEKKVGKKGRFYFRSKNFPIFIVNPPTNLS